MLVNWQFLVGADMLHYAYLPQPRLVEFVYFKVSFNWLGGHSLLPPGSAEEPECDPADPGANPHT